ncbi:type IV pilin [Methanocorpusculum sp. MG]|uniref:Type IV pilin n=1 Tax=Methanocorpusculum petauri TaxID=3002863 RepID=A0ABT4IE25_9EURY|nr:type IV pilin [Methanocorpusculum petauri]MCZ0859831.1 type IV pilin [Methanocorpusculum petauri]MDE2443894.1 type IV pilin [Methanocorpusculum sp.]
MTKSDSAVSEVVGVLLLLTITLILVSLVAVAMNSAVSTTDKPVSATIVGSIDKDKNYITFENIAGDSFVLDQIEVRLGIRERPADYTTVRNSGESRLLNSYSNESVVGLGDRFYIALQNTAGGFSLMLPDSSVFPMSSKEHLTYRIYDRRTSTPVSSGEIAIP